MPPRVDVLMPRASRVYDAVAAEYLEPYRAGADAGITLVPRPWDRGPRRRRGKPDLGDHATACMSAPQEAAMGTIQSRTFRSDDGVAVELPEALGIPVGFPVRLEWEGQTVTLRPSSDDVETQRTWAEVLTRLAEIGPVEEIGARLPIDVPEHFGD